MSDIVERFWDTVDRWELPVDQGCKLPPLGWWCSREPGHEGPCAARPHIPDYLYILREPGETKIVVSREIYEEYIRIAREFY